MSRAPPTWASGRAASKGHPASTIDPEAQLYKKTVGQEVTQYFLRQVLMENRDGLAPHTRLSPTTGTAEREAAVALLDTQLPTQRITLGSKENSTTHQCVQDLRAWQSTPHFAQHVTNRARAIDGRTTHHSGYAVSPQKRTRAGKIFGWLNTRGVLRKGQTPWRAASRRTDPLSRRPSTTWGGSAIS
ncbi:MAG: hypothetical protein EHM80_05205 [Nitrospiraceae bacterium]|nr:MAG: hypothetical protein EHM80_05205 [Nitrospiraceae bacterium]